MEYLRKSRMDYAMLEVCQGRRILDVAMDHGYSNERSFSRAFAQQFGGPPSQFRGSCQYSVPPKPVLEQTNTYYVGGRAMADQFGEVRLGKLPTMTVASAVRIGTTPEDDVIAFMDGWAEANEIDSAARGFGFDYPVSDAESRQGLRGYEYWVVVPGGTTASDVTVKTIPGCQYAVLRITDPFANPFQSIPLGWRTLANWVDEKGYKTSCNQQRYWLEEVVEIDGVTFMDLYFPIS